MKPFAQSGIDMTMRYWGEQELPGLQAYVDQAVAAWAENGGGTVDTLLQDTAVVISQFQTAAAANNPPDRQFLLLAQKARAGYCSAKAGINMLTKVLASEWGEHGIRVNAIAPGVVMTDLVQEGIDQGIVSEDQYLGRIPMGHLGALDDVVEAALFLASDEASFVTGEVLRLDGGWTAYHLFYPIDKAF